MSAPSTPSPHRAPVSHRDSRGRCPFASMDDHGCLAQSGTGGAPPPLFGTFVAGSGGFAFACLASLVYAAHASRLPHAPPAGGLQKPVFGFPAADTVALLSK